jgi:2,3-bisphosphoglycerate-independent phosphoglycerate mutase
LLLLTDLLGDPLPELDGRTALEAARTPQLAALAALGTVGRVPLGGTGDELATANALAALLGYDTARAPLALGPLEAAAWQVPLEPHDVAFRLSLITTDGETLVDPTAGGVTTDEAHALIDLVQSRLGSRRRTFFPGSGHRHLLRLAAGPVDLKTVSPHAFVGGSLTEHGPEGDDAEALLALSFDTLELLDGHDVNRRRRGEGLPAANMLWPWGHGLPVALPDFLARNDIFAALVAADDAARGVARCAGIRLFDRARMALEAGAELLVVMTSPPDTRADLDRRIAWIEALDTRLIGGLVDGFAQRHEPFRLAAVASQATPIDAPALLLRFDSTRETDGRLPFDERAREETRLTVDPPGRVLTHLLA